MAGIVSATKVQVETLYRAVRKLELELRFYNQGTEQPGTTPASRAAAIDALVDAAVAAIAPVNT
jgi:hypothetical protein